MSGSSEAKASFFLGSCVSQEIFGGSWKRYLCCTFGAKICCLLWKYESQGELTMLEKQILEKQILEKQILEKQILEKQMLGREGGGCFPVSGWSSDYQSFPDITNFRQ